MKSIFPSTTSRVELHTNQYVNNIIKKETYINIDKYADKNKEEIAARIKELDEEWDIERVLEANAAG